MLSPTPRGRDEAMRPATIGLLGVCVAILGGVCPCRASQDVAKQIKHGTASWYSSKDTCPHNPDPRCPMANGRSIYEQEATQPFFAASWDYPLGAHLLVTARTGRRGVRTTVVEVTDRGPAKQLVRQGRILDLSEKSFAAIADLKEGVINITVVVAFVAGG